MNYMIIALGNPGTFYEKTRHNAGWMVMDKIFPQASWDHNHYAEALVATEDQLLLVKPLTFMNLSGKSAAYFLDKKGMEPAQCIVLYDDIDLPLGKMKISFDRGSGGHNGIKSMEASLGTAAFIRIRIGISKILESGELVKPNVLGKFEAQELKVLETVAQRIKLAIMTILKDGKEFAMTEFNSPDPHVKVLKQ